jgi:hypothetical protein
VIEKRTSKKFCLQWQICHDARAILSIGAAGLHGARDVMAQDSPGAPLRGNRDIRARSRLPRGDSREPC